jgi:sugar O-acyltransferase (sialic acid O-acetyltransferase NeuD family)
MSTDSTAASAQVVIVGGGGHARMLVDALHAIGEPWTITVLDADSSRHGTLVLDAPIVGGDDALSDLIEAGATHFAVGIGTPVSGDSRPRRRIFERVLASGLVALTIVHPRAIVSPWATIGPGAQILPGAIVNAGVRIGMNTIVNSGAIVEHDCIVGDHVHVASGACLASAVTVGDGAHIGAGAVVRQIVRIGASAVVGAGAAVVHDVAAATVVAGVPAKALSHA